MTPDPATSENRGRGEEKSEDTNSKTERWSKLETSTPAYMTETDRRIWAYRRYYGVGPNGAFMEEWTQQEIADYLGVSRQSVNRWLNEPLPVVEGLSHRERQMLYLMIVNAKTDLTEEYLVMLDLENRGRDRSQESESRKSNSENSGVRSTQSVEPDSDPHPLDGLDEGFSW